MSEDPSNPRTRPVPKGDSLSAPSTGLSDPKDWVDLYGDYLFKIALVRLRDPSRAEDAVQETFLAALKTGQAFAGKSSERAWLVGILKHKIADSFRKTSRETSFTDLDFYQDEELESFVPEGRLRGSWSDAFAPQAWSAEPGASLDNEAFWKVFHQCAGKLPTTIRTAFCLREIDDLDSKEVCRRLNISENNLWVMLHRARMALRRCLEMHWFGKAERER